MFFFFLNEKFPWLGSKDGYRVSSTIQRIIPEVKTWIWKASKIFMIRSLYEIMEHWQDLIMDKYVHSV